MTIEVSIEREASTYDGTPGKWTMTGINGPWSCDTLELPWANNERGRSCVIADSYTAKLDHSDHLGGPKHQVYRLEDKHGRQNVLIHNANFAGEVKAGQETELHGCTSVGRGYGDLWRTDGVKKKQFAILASVKTLESLIENTGGDDLRITYTWAPGCEPAQEAT